MRNDTKMTKIIFKSRRSLAVIRPGYNIEAPDVFIVECLRTVVPPLSFGRRTRRIDLLNDVFVRLLCESKFVNCISLYTRTLTEQMTYLGGLSWSSGKSMPELEDGSTWTDSN